MTRYLVARLFEDNRPQDRVILFWAPAHRKTSPYIRRIAKISDFRAVGLIESDNDKLDEITETQAFDDALFKKTGVDVRHMTTPISAKEVEG